MGHQLEMETIGKHCTSRHRSETQSLRICMVCDFFYPKTGGVEMHIWSLAQCLLELGHKVVVVTHAYGDRQGVRYMNGGLKVYYLPLGVFCDQIIFPTFYSFFPLFRNILIRERINIVHSHQSTSSMATESILYARTMGYHVCHTEHSLFNVSDITNIIINAISKIFLSDIDGVIAVSNACRENILLRTYLDPSIVHTIPNAVDSSRFTPEPASAFTNRFPMRGDKFNIVLLSRLVHRKGIDLLVQLIPVVCARFPHVRFIIGGDGPKRPLLEQMRQSSKLEACVELLGFVEYKEVRDLLVRGHLFLNCSLTESFCIAILEAAACGLFVVSTNVGGIPEVLPKSMIRITEPTLDGLVEALSEAISNHAGPTSCTPAAAHAKVAAMYSWQNVAKRTEKVYVHVLRHTRPSLGQRLCKYAVGGRGFGPPGGCDGGGYSRVGHSPIKFLLSLVCMVTALYASVMLHMLWIVCEMIWPKDEIEISPDFNKFPIWQCDKDRSSTNIPAKEVMEYTPVDSS